MNLMLISKPHTKRFLKTFVTSWFIALARCKNIVLHFSCPNFSTIFVILWSSYMHRSNLNPLWFPFCCETNILSFCFNQDIFQRLMHKILSRFRNKIHNSCLIMPYFSNYLFWNQSQSPFFPPGSMFWWEKCN